MTDSLSSVQAISTADYLDGIGVNTHIEYTDGEYANVSQIISDMQYLGVNQIRDAISNGANGSAPIGNYISIAQAGIDFTFMVSGSNNADIEAQLQLVDQVEAARPGSVIAIEGANEINNWPVTFNGATGLQGAEEMQAAIVADVQADPNLSGVGVDYFTGYGSGGGAGTDVGPDPVANGMANYDNQHPYPNYNASPNLPEAPATWVSRASAFPNTSNPNEPAVYTETGYSTDTVNPNVQAVYTLDLLMDTAQQNISETYLYDLMDAYAPGSPQGDDGFGLFDYTTAPKPVATAIHNLTSILQDSSGSANVSPGSLDYSISGLPSTGNSLLMEKPDGDYVLSVWAEPEIWNSATQSEVGAPTDYVTISLGNSFNTAQVFDPMQGTNAIASYTGGDTVTIAVSDSPILIDLNEAPASDRAPQIVPPTTGTQISNDAPCFAAETRILTVQGEVAVEYLAVGDTLITHSGDEAAIIWIGKRTIDLCRHPKPEKAQPIRIAADTFGEGAPSRDLILSPDHALFLKEHLIPAKTLVNNANITQLQRKTVTYYHIELAEHSVIFAENVAVESYLETGNRGSFENGAGALTLFPDFAQTMREEKSCAPFTDKGPVVDAIRCKLAEQRSVDAGMFMVA